VVLKGPIEPLGQIQEKSHLSGQVQRHFVHASEKGNKIDHWDLKTDISCSTMRIDSNILKKHSPKT